MEPILNGINNLNGNHITLISIVISFGIFVYTQYSNYRISKYEKEKDVYKSFIEFYNDSMNKKQSKNINNIAEADKKKFFTIGSELMLYGSKKIYRKYLFFRNLETNPIIKKSKYYDKSLNLYVIADIFLTVRNEINMNANRKVGHEETIAFYVNDINNPISKVKFAECQFKVKMIKIELFFFSVINFVLFKKIYYKIIMPILGIIGIIYKYFLLIPVGRLLIKVLNKKQIMWLQDYDFESVQKQMKNN